MHTTHWALQPWDDPRSPNCRSQPRSYCEPRWTHRRPRNQTPLLRHAPAYAPGTGQGGSRTLFRTWPVYWAAHVPPSPQMPPRGLWIPFTPPRVRATHAGQSGQCGVQSQLRQAGHLDRPVWPSAIREWPKEQCSESILLHFPHSKVL